VDYFRIAITRELARSELPLSFGPFLSFLNEFLDKIGNDQSTSAIEMNAVGVKAPTIDPGDFVGAFAQHQSAESIAINDRNPNSVKARPGDFLTCADIASWRAI
jgi:transketolase C-terminal domain/subunit